MSQKHCGICGSPRHARHQHEAANDRDVAKLRETIALYPWLAFLIGPWRPDEKDRL